MFPGLSHRSILRLRLFPPATVKSVEPKKHPDIRCVVMGRVLRELRESLGLSLEETAVRAGVSRQTVRFAEFATHAVRMDICWQIAWGLGMRYSELVVLAEAILEQERQR